MRLERMSTIALCTIGLIFGLCGIAEAQVTPQAVGGYVVATCGTPPAGYPLAGGIGVELHDVNGNLCAGVTVNANVNTSGLATSANQTNGGQKTEVVDGSGNVLPTLPSGPVTLANADGVVVTYNALTSGGITVAMSATTSTLIVAPTAGQYIYLGGCRFSNASTTVSTDIILQDGASGTTIDLIPVPAAAVATTGGGGAITEYGANTPLKVPTLGNGLYAANVTTGSSTKVWCNGFKSSISY